GGDPIGRRVRVGDEPERVFRVVGVVEDVRPFIEGESPPAEIYWSNRQLPR
ncbi:MAG: hypothetical protein GWN71_08885, partial [Gammaproteobacteria bacterium]|nr:hypothetical protein [Gemmatimonadota bacterium]NIU73678.1 hypothetical protein [Gammaproteobacteria bacterium]